MPIMKPLLVPHHLEFLTALHARKELSADQLHHLDAMKKGYAGERLWTTYLNQLQEDIPILYDLNLEINQSLFQIDALCILQNKLVIFEIKNYNGNYSMVEDKWFSPNKKEMKSPLIQIKRNEPLIYQFLKKHQLPISYEYRLILVNPAFVLYGASPNENVIFPGQISQFIDTIKKQTISPTGLHSKIIDTLLTNHQERFNMLVKPEYHYDELAKGIFCSNCGEKMERVNKKSFRCPNCNEFAILKKVVLEMIKQYKLLFPQQKITKNIIYHWCDGQINNFSILRGLQQSFTEKGKGRGVYYE